MDASDTGISTSSRARGRRGAATPAASVAPSIVVLGPRDSLVGTLTVDGDVRIEGTLDGEVSGTLPANFVVVSEALRVVTPIDFERVDDHRR